MSPLMLHACEQFGILSMRVVATLGVLAATGAGLVWLCFPRSAALRWPIYAPLAGAAMVTVGGLWLGRAGVPVATWAPWFTFGAVATAGVALLRRCRTRFGRRILFSWCRARGLGALGLVFVVVGISTLLITRSPHSDVRDIWGSSDFGAYWIVADFLQEHGATVTAYSGQTAFRATDVVDHLTRHARMGCMVHLAFVARLLWPGAAHEAILPAIVTFIVLMVGLAHCWLEIERARGRWLLWVVLAHPFLYFLIYFSYVSQASGMALFLGGVLLTARRPVTLRSSLAGGALLGSSILHHPVLLPVAAIYVGTRFAFGRRTEFPSLAGMAAAAVLVEGAYLGATARELLSVSGNAILPGWEWRGLIGALELAGVRSVLGYDMPEARPRWILALDAVAGGVMVFLISRYLQSGRLRSAAVSMLVATVALTSVGLAKYFDGIPNATHAVVKTVSLFSVFLFLIAVLTLLRSTPARVAAPLAIVIGGLHALALLRSTPQRPVFTRDLIGLVRGVLERTPGAIEFRPPLHPLLLAPVVRTVDRLAGESGASGAPAVRIVDRRIFPLTTGSPIAESTNYYAVSVEPLGMPWPTDVERK